MLKLPPRDAVDHVEAHRAAGPRQERLHAEVASDAAERGRGLGGGDEELVLVGAVDPVAAEREGRGHRAVGVVEDDVVVGDELLAVGVHLDDDVLGVGVERRARVDLGHLHDVEGRVRGPRVQQHEQQHERGEPLAQHGEDGNATTVVRARDVTPGGVHGPAGLDPDNR